MYLILLIVGFVTVGYVVLMRSFHFIMNALFIPGSLSVVTVVAEVLPDLLSIFLCTYVLFLIGQRFLQHVDSLASDK